MYIFWASLGVLFLGIDYFKKNKITLTLATSFLLNSALVYKISLNYFQQVGAFLVIFGITYKLISMIFEQEKKDMEKQLEKMDYIGIKALVKKDIGKKLSIDGLGCIELNNKIWQAKSIDDKEIKAGNEVEIVSTEGLIMNVKTIN